LDGSETRRRISIGESTPIPGDLPSVKILGIDPMHLGNITLLTTIFLCPPLLSRDAYHKRQPPPATRDPVQSHHLTAAGACVPREMNLRDPAISYFARVIFAATTGPSGSSKADRLFHFYAIGKTGAASQRCSRR